jgi:hypothetical protein
MSIRNKEKYFPLLTNDRLFRCSGNGKRIDWRCLGRLNIDLCQSRDRASASLAHGTVAGVPPIVAETGDTGGTGLLTILAVV